MADYEFDNKISDFIRNNCNFEIGYYDKDKQVFEASTWIDEEKLNEEFGISISLNNLLNVHPGDEENLYIFSIYGEKSQERHEVLSLFQIKLFKFIHSVVSENLNNKLMDRLHEEVIREKDEIEESDNWRLPPTVNDDKTNITTNQVISKSESVSENSFFFRNPPDKKEITGSELINYYVDDDTLGYRLKLTPIWDWIEPLSHCQSIYFDQYAIISIETLLTIKACLSFLEYIGPTNKGDIGGGGYRAWYAANKSIMIKKRVSARLQRAIFGVTYSSVPRELSKVEAIRICKSNIYRAYIWDGHTKMLEKHFSNYPTGAKDLTLFTD